jgi:RNA polymerase sigma factor (sigma-70 family)
VGSINENNNPKGVLFMKHIKTLNEAQRNLAAEHTEIVKWAIRKHINVNKNKYGLDYDDLFQEGCLYLCHAAATYDGERAQFETYAQVVVKNGLLTYCKMMCGKNKNNTDTHLTDDRNDLCLSAVSDTYNEFVSNTAVYDFLESVKAQYDGVTRLGIEALELKVRGYTGADIARLWGVEQNHIGAWISRAKKKLCKNERFMAEFNSA